MRGGLVGAAAVALAMTSGCVSAGNGAQTGSGAAAPSPSVAAECDLVTTAQLNRVLGVSFVAPRSADPSSTAGVTVCQWTAADQTALVVTKVLTRDAPLIFESSFEESQRSVGITVPVKVPGATSAFRVASLGRTSMLIGKRFVEVSVLVPTATPQQVEQIAAQVARAAR